MCISSKTSERHGSARCCLKASVSSSSSPRKPPIRTREWTISFPTFPLGYVSDDKHIVDIYNSADVFVLPSLSENLPNTIMEAMACGVPSVGFRVGGIPEMIDHKKNGYVANYREADQSALQQSCLAKVMHNYSQHAVALNYIEIYNEAMAYKHYRI